MNWDPITRIVGSLGIFTKIDFEKGKVAECHSTSSIFRGYSIFMKGKDPRDAHFITSRICGICGDNHATCSCLRAEHGLRRQAAGAGRVDRQPRRSRRVHVRPQHLPGQPGRRRLLREDGQAETNPACWEKAKKTEAPHAGRTATRPSPTSCGALNPFTGEFYREALQVSRYTREMFCLMEGRHVHPSTLYPRRRRHRPTIQLFTDYYVRLMRYVEFMKKVVPLHDDLFDFFYEALPGYEEGRPRRILLGCWGSFQDPDVCDYDYKT
jgi:hydrogenase large subunit